MRVLAYCIGSIPQTVVETATTLGAALMARSSPFPRSLTLPSFLLLIIGNRSSLAFAPLFGVRTTNATLPAVILRLLSYSLPLSSFSFYSSIYGKVYLFLHVPSCTREISLAHSLVPRRLHWYLCARAPRLLHHGRCPRALRPTHVLVCQGRLHPRLCLLCLPRRCPPRILIRRYPWYHHSFHYSLR